MPTEVIKINKIFQSFVDKAVAYRKCKVIGEPVLSTDPKNWQGTEIYEYTIEYNTPADLVGIGFSLGSYNRYNMDAEFPPKI
jgi:hypothetical protein